MQQKITTMLAIKTKYNIKTNKIISQKSTKTANAGICVVSNIVID